MSMPGIIIATPDMEALPPTAGAAHDGPTPLRNIPSASPKATICDPNNRENMGMTL